MSGWVVLNCVLTLLLAVHREVVLLPGPWRDLTKWLSKVPNSRSPATKTVAPSGYHTER